jgi:membrane-bound ClpP family serine protease
VVGLRRARRYALLVVGFVVMAFGSFFLIPAPQAINPLVVVFVLLFSCAFVWWAGRRSLEAMNLPPQHLFSQIGQIGEARTDIFAEGTVSVGGEEWTGRSKTFIPAGSSVRVVGREGLVLVVELYNS